MYVVHILKAIVPADNLSDQNRSFEHPTRRQIFANTVGRICKLNLTLRRKDLCVQSVPDAKNGQEYECGAPTNESNAQVKVLKSVSNIHIRPSFSF